MSTSHEIKIAFALQQTSRVMSMLSLIEAALKLEIRFQEEHITRPSYTAEYIPGLGEVVDTVAACREGLNDCWSTLISEAPRE